MTTTDTKDLLSIFSLSRLTRLERNIQGIDPSVTVGQLMADIDQTKAALKSRSEGLANKAAEQLVGRHFLLRTEWYTLLLKVKGIKANEWCDGGASFDAECEGIRVQADSISPFNSMVFTANKRGEADDYVLVSTEQGTEYRELDEDSFVRLVGIYRDTVALIETL
jgi:hypothetical protein